MPAKIAKIIPGSVASQAGIKAGDEISKIDNRNVNDILDLYYFGSRRQIKLRVLQADGSSKTYALKRKQNEDWGIELEPYRPKTCVNHCVFCFIDQMPPGLRASLYLKDDDYIHSMLHGSYITLSNLKPQELRRIYEMGISPLYISLHSTNQELRRQMMRYDKPLRPLKILENMTNRDIDFHLQFVLVPGMNDGNELKRSLYELLELELNIASIGVVPVGITKYREKLCKILPFDQDGALETLEIIDDLRDSYDFTDLYAADEFYLLAGQEIPDDEYYQEYPQLENGIGLLRLGLVQYHENKAQIKKAFTAESKYRVFTSEAAFEHINSIFKDLALELPDAEFKVQSIKAEFFGGQVNVAGLLCYQDFAAQARLEAGETAVLPAHIFNSEELSLDGHHLQDFIDLFGGQLTLVHPLFEGWEKVSSEDFT